jgi:urea transport system permease protein
MALTAFLDALFNGLSFGSILVLAALGLSITFGVMRVINMAHGEMLMLGAYVGWVVTDPRGVPKLLSGLAGLVGMKLDVDFGLHLSLFAAIPIAFVVVGAFGYVLERGLIRFLYGRPLDTLLATWGVGLILQQLIRLIFGADIKSLATPEVLTGNFEWRGATFPHLRIFVVAITGVCILAIYLWFFKTKFGLKIRAVVQNRPMAAALGIRTRQVDALTFAFGTGLAGVAGCIVGPLYNVSPDMGGSYIVEAFLVVILGGTGQFVGTIAGGALIGLCQSVVAKFYNNSLVPGLFPAMISEVDQPMSKVTSLVLVLGFILIRPSGLFPTKERSYD